MITFNDIARVNDQLRTTDIKNKDYVMVNERIKAFRMLYPQGYIITRIANLEGGMVTMVAEAGYYDEEGKPILLGTGTAYEKESSNNINKTSYIENCETSAVGRALGMLGFGIDTSIASYEEVKNAQLNQEPAQPTIITTLNENASDEIKSLYNTFTFDLNGNINAVLKAKNMTDVNEITVDIWKKLIEWQTKKNEAKGTR